MAPLILYLTAIFPCRCPVSERGSNQQLQEATGASGQACQRGPAGVHSQQPGGPVSPGESRGQHDQRTSAQNEGDQPDIGDHVSLKFVLAYQVFAKVAGSAKANVREPKTGLVQVFNLKLGCFDDVCVLIYTDTRPHL